MLSRIRKISKKIIAKIRRPKQAIEPETQITEKKSRTRAIAYTGQFKQFIRQNHGIIKEFQRLKDCLSEGAKLKSGNMLITKLPKTASGPFIINSWRIDIGEKSFFVKETIEPVHSGTSQFTTLHKLKKILDANKKSFPHIEIADYHIGWQYKRRHFLATDFYELKRLTQIRVPRKLIREFEQLSKLALQNQIWDVKEKNAFYDKKRKKIIVFDTYKID